MGVGNKTTAGHTMQVEVEYLSSGVNQTPRGIDCGPTGVCLAASSGVLLYHPEVGAVVGASTKQHSKRVRCVRWVRQTSHSSPLVVSGSDDGKVVLWTVSEAKTEQLYMLHPSSVLEHGQSVNLVDAMVVEVEGKAKILVVTAATNSITSWLVCQESGTNQKLHSLTTPGDVFVVSLKLFNIPEAKFPLVMFGGHDSKVHILASKENGIYECMCQLSGHQDWVTALDIMMEDDGRSFVATGSKDATVRLWRLSVVKDLDQNKDLLLNSEKELKLKSTTFIVPSTSGDDVVVSVVLEAVLAGHEGLVSEVCWAKPLHSSTDESTEVYKLLTCSKTQDRSIIIWEQDRSGGSEMWLETARLGEVGGNMEGFLSSQFIDNGSKVLGCNFQGGLHLWELQNGVWVPRVAASGHFNQVTDVAWDTKGRYLLSVSKDQTTRLHAAWKQGDNKVVWHEVGRPQVHGYDMACIASLGNHKFVSGAEEKVMRGFAAPANFIRNFGNICGYDMEDDLASCEVGEGAAVPSLGLSNKAVTAADLQEEHQVKAEGREEVQSYFKPLSLSAPPTEDQLMQNTLWPEAAKLYGHGNEIFAVAVSSDGSLLASSCRATNNIDAAIILWDTKTWDKVDSLKKHRLTVTQLAFSPDDEYLLSVSRDRSWAVFKRTSENKGVKYEFSDSATKETEHARIIWSCAWLPNSSGFLTASRDKTVRVWGVSKGSWTRKSLLTEPDEVTAVAVAKIHDSNSVLVATGLEAGSIHLRQYNLADSTFSLEVVKVLHEHHSTVRRLAFQPTLKCGSESLHLASCSNDSRVQIYKINV